MRIGQNPHRSKKIDYRSSSITVGVITHLPNREGYHEDRLDIIGLCLASMKQRATIPFDLLVYDNGSCDDLTSLLGMCRRKGLIDILVLSENVGKRAATRRLVSMAPGFILGYSDDDMLYMDGWLAPQVDILARYPNVGLVTGMPTHACFGWGTSSATRLGKVSPDVKVTYPDWPDEWIEDYIRSVGVDMPRDSKVVGKIPSVPMTLAEYHRKFEKIVPTMLEYNGVKAWGTSHHAQFVAYKEIVEPFTYVKDQREYYYMSGVPIWLDKPIDNAGYLRLATPDLLVRHIGNKMDDTIEKLAEGVERWW